MPPQPVRTASPPQWTPNGSVVVPAGSGYSGGVPVQVAGQRAGRQTVVVVNTGAGSCTLLSAQGQSGLTGVTLAAGGDWSLDTEGEVWIASVAGTTVDVVETWWPREDAHRSDLPVYAGAFK